MSHQDDDNTPAVTRPTTDHEAGVPQLVVVGGPNVGTAYRLAAPELIIGRDQDADVRLSNPSVSRHHARLTIDAQGVWIEDLDSKNGTFVGLDRVIGRTLVREGDNVGLGIYTFLKLTRFASIGEIVGRAIENDAGAGRATKIGSWDYLLYLLRVEYAYARRHDTPLSLLFVRADAVTEICEAGPSSLAEEAMGHLGAAIDGAIRAEDCLARASLDEFIIVVRDAGDGAERLAERARVRVELLASRPASPLLAHTITIVVLQVRPESSSDLQRRHPFITANEVISAARALAEPHLRANSNRVVRLPPLTI